MPRRASTSISNTLCHRLCFLVVAPGGFFFCFQCGRRVRRSGSRKRRVDRTFSFQSIECATLKSNKIQEQTFQVRRDNVSFSNTLCHRSLSSWSHDMTSHEIMTSHRITHRMTSHPSIIYDERRATHRMHHIMYYTYDATPVIVLREIWIALLFWLTLFYIGFWPDSSPTIKYTRGRSRGKWNIAKL